MWINWEELKALHRLPGNKIFFSLFSRMPGTSYEKLINQMNSNPRPHIKVFMSIQLFEPFSQHYYLARRLKQLKVISNYRLDENGVTHIIVIVNKLSSNVLSPARGFGKVTEYLTEAC